MGLFKKVLRLGLDVATSPIAIVSDILTMGGAATQTESKIKGKLEQLEDDYEEIRDELN